MQRQRQIRGKSAAASAAWEKKNHKGMSDTVSGLQT